MSFQLRAGDVVVSRARGIFSWFLRLITAVRTNSRVGEIMSHIEVAVGKALLFSAEKKGMDFVTWEKRLSGALIVEVYRFKEKIDQELFDKLVDSLKGSKYAYSRWVLNFSVLFVFFASLFGFLGSVFSLHFSLGMFIIALFIYFPVRYLLKKHDLLTYDCSRAVSHILSGMKIYHPIDQEKHDTPNSIRHVMINLRLHGVVIRVK